MRRGKGREGLEAGERAGVSKLEGPRVGLARHELLRQGLQRFDPLLLIVAQWILGGRDVAVLVRARAVTLQRRDQKALVGKGGKVPAGSAKRRLPAGMRKLKTFECVPQSVPSTSQVPSE